MNTLNRIVVSVLSALALVVLPSMVVVAEEMDHSHMHGDQHQSTVMPTIGTSHESMNHDMHVEPAKDDKTMPSEHGQHAEHDMTTNQEQHAGHTMAAPPKTLSSQISLQPLTQSPPSGKAREAGYDGRYAMENTSIDLPLSAKCALASRGLVMLDKASRNQCGGQSSDTTDKMPASTPSGMHDHHGM